MKVAHTKPPAKLNLFLELLGKRGDGFHEIDTVMVPVDLCDELSLWRTDQPGTDLKVDWLPSMQEVASRLDVQPGSKQADELLGIPTDASNLVSRALKQFADIFDIEGGFGCQLGKRIPAGAGMGGASSDAASALMAASRLCGVPHDAPHLKEIAASIGSDVPFFLGDSGRPLQAARAQGRGEVIQPVGVACPLHFVLVFPAASLSTAKVYARAKIPDVPHIGDAMVDGLQKGDRVAVENALSNRLAQSAKEILPRIDEILHCMWRSGMQACQLTGSGSACFALVASADEAHQSVDRLRSVLEPGAFVACVRNVSLPASVTLKDG